MKAKVSRGPEKKETAPQANIITVFFTSVRTTITLLFLLALCAILGTVIPQGEMADVSAGAGHSFVSRIAVILDLNNVYRSWWFTGLLVLLAMNILGCLLKRAPFIISEWKGDQKKRSFFLTLTDSRSPDELKKLFSERLKTIMKGAPKQINSDSGSELSWERQKIYLLGFPLIHIAIIVILIGGLIGVFFGFRGHVQIKVNEKSSTYALLSTGEVKTLPFTIAVDAFTLTRYPTGEPKEFRSDIRLIDQSGDELKGSIRVNHPITFDGISLYQSDYRIVGISKVSISIQTEDGPAETISVNPMEPLITTKGSGMEIKIRGFDPGSSQRGAGIEVVVSAKDGKPSTIRLYENDTAPVKIGGVKLGFKGYEPTYATGLQVGYDPGSRVVWIGSIMLIFGFILTLFTNIQRLNIELIRENDKTRITVSGRSKRMRKEFREWVESTVKDTLKTS